MNKCQDILQHIFSLLIVFLMLAATTLTTGRIFGYEWNRPEEVTDGLVFPDEVQMRGLGLDGCVLRQKNLFSWSVSDNEGRICGTVASSGPFADAIEGYAGTTPLYVYIDTLGVVRSVVSGQNDETPRFYRRVVETIFPQWCGLETGEALTLDIDAVTGATYSSNSIVQNMKAVLAAYQDASYRVASAPVIGWFRTVVFLFVLLAGFLVSSCFKGVKWLRLAVLALNVAVAGFWCGQFISLSLLRGWFLNGMNWIAYLPALVMLLVAILMPFFGKHKYYCIWMCPLGSFQELAWYVPVRKIKVTSRVFKWMSRVRTLFLIVLMALLWTGFGQFYIDYEPFAAFLIESASPVVMVLAGVFVLLGIFVPRPWCRCLCPVGGLLDLAEQTKSSALKKY